MRRLILIIILFSFIKVKGQTTLSAIADSLYQTGDYIHAINEYAKLGSSQSNLQIARTYNAIGNYDKAVVQYENVISKDASAQIARFELGKLYFQTRKFVKAADIFYDLIASGARNAQYYYYMGRSLYELKSFNEGTQFYKSAFKIDNTHLQSISQLGKHYVVKKEKDSVLKYVDSGLKFYENDVSLINWKALALFNNSEFENAIPWFEKLLELGEHKEYIYTKLAHCYFKSLNFEKAKETYRILLDINDANGDTYYNLGHVFFKNKELDSAQYFIKKSIEVQQVSFEKEYATLGQIAREGNDLKSAVDYYRLSHKEDPTNIINYYQFCVLADQYYKDPQIRLKYYESLIKMYGTKQQYFSEFATKRISELKEEIHFKTD